MEIRKLVKDKRGLGIGDIYPIIIIIATVAILIAILLIVFNEWQDITNTIEGENINDTLGNVTEIGQYIDNYSLCGFADFAITKLVNESTGETVTAGNYSSSADGKIWFIDPGGGGFNNTFWNVSYTYSYGGEDCDLMESITEDLGDFIKWIGIILLVVAAAIVLGIVISSFASDKRV